MDWLGKTKRTDIRDEAIGGPTGDIEATRRIRVICRSAADTAKKSGKADDQTHRSTRSSDVLREYPQLQQ